MAIDSITKLAELEALAQMVEKYHQLQEQEEFLKADKEALRGQILDEFKSRGIREYVAGDLKAEVTTRATRSISVREAESLLPPEMLTKLIKEGMSIFFAVRHLKKL